MSTPFLGEIRLFPYTFAPVNWHLCDGSLLSIAEYDALYTLLGTTYGGDGVTTFALPDLRGRVPVHQGIGNGLTPRTMGELGGTEQVAVTTPQLPAHTHTFSATTTIASINAPGPTAEFGGLSTDAMYTGTVAGSTISTAAATISPAGGSQPHDNTMPTLAASFCIALFGIYPSQN